VKAQAVQFKKILSRDETFKVSDGSFGDGRFNMGYSCSAQKLYLHLLTVQQ
jgi:hypothetical protein